jgi:hypothetical protein
MGKAIRFSELVQKSGRPYAATLWTDPNKDPDFQKAVKENRVVTVKQETVGSKKDFGTIGFSREKNVSYFIFPKKLPNVPDARVVGIKYDLLQAVTRDPVFKGDARSHSREKGGGVGMRTRGGVVAKKKSPPKAPREKEFVATVKRTAVWETSLRVKAKNKTEAKRRVVSAMAEQKFPESEAVVRHEIRSLDEV